MRRIWKGAWTRWIRCVDSQIQIRQIQQLKCSFRSTSLYFLANSFVHVRLCLAVQSRFWHSPLQYVARGKKQLPRLVLKFIHLSCPGTHLTTRNTPLEVMRTPAQPTHRLVLAIVHQPRLLAQHIPRHLRRTNRLRLPFTLFSLKTLAGPAHASRIASLSLSTSTTSGINRIPS
jgi:hypothetical protein